MPDVQSKQSRPQCNPYMPVTQTKAKNIINQEKPINLHNMDSEHIFAIKRLPTHWTSSLPRVDETLYSQRDGREGRYIDTRLAEHMPTKSNSGILPSIVANSASSDPLSDQRKRSVRTIPDKYPNQSYQYWPPKPALRPAPLPTGLKVSPFLLQHQSFVFVLLLPLQSAQSTEFSGQRFGCWQRLRQSFAPPPSLSPPAASSPEFLGHSR